MAETDPPPILQDAIEGEANRRSATRDSLFLLTTLFDDCGRSLGQARIRNLSRTGLMAECDLTFRDGDRLAVELRGVGTVAGIVSWVRGRRVGMAFDTPIDPRAARKPVHIGPSDKVPPYLRTLPRVARFSR